jgi:ComF family protein
MLRALAEVLLPGSCPGCGAPAEPVCASCASTLRAPPRHPTPAGLDELVVAFAYDGVARELVARIKYRNARGAVAWLADAMLAGCVAVDSVDVVTWAPTTPARRRARGFDHAELLARALGRRAGLPVRGLLTRLPGAPQTGARRAARVAGPRFRARAAAAGRHVLLVDDVVTTAATFTAGALALRRAGAPVVFGVAAARTP